ncbi:MAG: type I 3-dehydroquinate dehydratase [Lachnospiraceae bacterium]|nr:type I 3-dehydroquinate dehydratase [Lachnospiraceae bacterium]
MKTLNLRGTAIGGGLPVIACPVMTADLHEAEILAHEAAFEGADLIEFRADPLIGNERLSLLPDFLMAIRRASGDLPLLFTVRTKEEGGSYPISDPLYTKALLAASKSGLIDIADIEAMRADAPDLIRTIHGYGIPVLLSNHDFDATPPSMTIVSRLLKMEEMGADIAKAAYMPEKAADTGALLSASAYAGTLLSIPHIAISMGAAGQPSRELCEVFSSALTFGTAGGRGSAPGQMDVAALRSRLREVNRWYADTDFLFLTGFMGSGKSTAARILSERFDIPVLEMDAEIEAMEGKSIPDIFRENGETYFRDLETAFLTSLPMRETAVISCGGGSVLRPENAAVMHRLGRIVYLDVQPETVFARLGERNPDRPVLGEKTEEGKIAALLDRRRPLYESAADAVICADHRTPEEIAAEIQAFL